MSVVVSPEVPVPVRGIFGRRDLRVRSARFTDDDEVEVVLGVDGLRPLRGGQTGHVHPHADLTELVLDDVCKWAVAVEKFHVVEREFTIGELLIHSCFRKKFPRLLWIVLRGFRVWIERPLCGS